MSTSYEETTTSHTTSGGGSDLSFDKAYLTSISGILKIVEIVVTLVAFICAVIPFWAAIGGGWVQFVTIMACITTSILFVFHLIRLIYKLPGPWGLIEFIYYIVFVVLLLTAALTSAVQAARWGWAFGGAIAAAAFFCFAAVAVYAVDLFFHFRDWRAGSTTDGGTSASTTTTTHTSYETKTNY